MDDWSRGDLIALAALFITIIGAIAAIAVIQKAHVRNSLFVILFAVSLLLLGAIIAHKNTKGKLSPMRGEVITNQGPTPFVNSTLSSSTTAAHAATTHSKNSVSTPEPTLEPPPKPTELPSEPVTVTSPVPITTATPSIARDGEFIWRVNMPYTGRWVDTRIPVNYWNNVNIREIDNFRKTSHWVMGSVVAQLKNREFYSDRTYNLNIYLGNDESVNPGGYSYWHPVPMDFQDTIKLKLQEGRNVNLIVYVYNCKHAPTNCNHKK